MLLLTFSGVAGGPKEAMLHKKMDVWVKRTNDAAGCAHNMAAKAEEESARKTDLVFAHWLLAQRYRCMHCCIKAVMAQNKEDYTSRATVSSPRVTF